jgi:probable addiction module antidote protein
MPKRTSNYNSWQLEKLTNPETAAAYLSAAISDSPEMFRKALRIVAQASQMTTVARKAGVKRESLYRATSEIGNPTLDTLHPVLKAVGITMKFEATEASAASTVPSSGGTVISDRVGDDVILVPTPKPDQALKYAAFAVSVGAIPRPNSGGNIIELDRGIYQQSSLGTYRTLVRNTMEAGEPFPDYGFNLNAEFETSLTPMAAMQQKEQEGNVCQPNL